MLTNLKRRRFFAGGKVLNATRKETISQRRSLLQVQVKPMYSVLIAATLMVFLIFFVYRFNIPNPNMILIAGLVISSAFFGYSGGIVAGIIMFLYTLFFFSTDHSFIQFTGQNMAKVLVSLFGIVVDLVFVCELKHAEMRAFKEVHKLTRDLSEENQLLQKVSMYDPLTGIRNRLALRQDYSRYEGKDMTVIMLDLDNFKAINDHFGHDEGDRVLKETGTDLINSFGKDHCYRYGGDEFLVLLPDVEEQVVDQELKKLMANRPWVKEGGRSTQAGYSIGVFRAREGERYSLREMFLLADNRMYHAKGSGKNRIVDTKISGE